MLKHTEYSVSLCDTVAHVKINTDEAALSLSHNSLFHAASIQNNNALHKKSTFYIMIMMMIQGSCSLQEPRALSIQYAK